MNKWFQVPRRLYCSPVQIFIFASLLMGLMWSPAAANGVPVQVFLEYVPFKSTWSPAEGGRGVAVVAANDEQVRVMAQNLPEPPAGQVYYAWLEKVAGGFMPVGTLDYRSDGTASLNRTIDDLPYSENFSWVLVSLEEPAHLGQAPSLDVALAGRLPNAMALPYREDQLPALLPVTGAADPIGHLSLWRWLGLWVVGVVLVVGGRRQLVSLAGWIGRRIYTHKEQD